MTNNVVIRISFASRLNFRPVSCTSKSSRPVFVVFEIQFNNALVFRTRCAVLLVFNKQDTMGITLRWYEEGTKRFRANRTKVGGLFYDENSPGVR